MSLTVRKHADCTPRIAATVKSAAASISTASTPRDDRRAGAAHAGALHRDRFALVAARIAEQTALRVPLHDVVEVGLGDVLRTERVTRKEDRLGVLAGLRADVDRHGA